MPTMTRNDIHRPSAIDPADYDFVAVGYDKTDTIDEVYSLNLNRQVLREFIERTGAKFSNHRHGGNCHICGAHCVYHSIWHHRPTNQLIRVGFDCTEKLFDCDPDIFKAFRADIHEARERKAGKNKAQAILQDLELSRAWELYNAEDSELERIEALTIESVENMTCDDCAPFDSSNCQNPNCNGGQLEFPIVTERKQYASEFLTLRDIVGRLVRSGFMSEKQESYLRSLVETIDNRAEIEAKRAAEKQAERDSAADCPTGRVLITGKILSVKWQYSQYGDTLKMLVCDASGFKVWGSVPGSIMAQGDDTLHRLYKPRNDFDDYNDGPKIDRTIEHVIEFRAAVEPSKDDCKFGFFKRPTKTTLTIAD